MCYSSANLPKVGSNTIASYVTADSYDVSLLGPMCKRQCFCVSQIV
jgi:hypothetical protein